MTIKQQLKSALIESCDDSLYFSGDETSLIDAEYLLTVNSVKSIKKLNSCFGDPYKIFLEHSTAEFSTNCPPPVMKVKTNTPFRRSILRNSKLNTALTGKIDIAIYDGRAQLPKPECAIEVKGFNPQKDKILDDLIRNLEYFTMQANTGTSRLPSAYFIALHSYKNTMSDKKEASNLKRVEKRYWNYLSTLQLPSQVKASVEIFTIRRGLVPDKDDPHTAQFGLDGTEDYHFMGAIIGYEV
ncbi:hypothetical protein H4F20_03285 [Vibrio sp. 16]|uniref:hypothetical protein n=1 Tax=Vibrio sp. 16 TaxID=391586 RepID=UPI002FEF7202